MKFFARLFALLAMAASLVVPATVPAANAAPTDGTMTYTVPAGQRVFHPAVVVVRKATAALPEAFGRLIVKNEDTEDWLFTITLNGVQTLGTPVTIAKASERTFEFAEAGTYKITSSGGQIFAGTIQVLPT